MFKYSSVWCCAGLTLVIGSFAALAVGQEDTPLFPLAEPGLSDAGEIGEVLDAAGLAESVLGQAEGGGPQDFCRCMGDTHAAKIQDALRSPLRDGLAFEDQPLREVVSALEQEYGIPIKIDVQVLEEAGLSPDENVTVKLSGISLRAALRTMLKDLQLAYIIQDEVLLITSPEEAETQLQTCIYDVRELSAVKKAGGLNKLAEIIMACVATETWAANGGGEAEIRSLEPGLLFISQTQAVHEEVRELLEAIRQISAGSTNDAAAKGKTPTADPKEEVVTRSYMLQIPPTEDAREMREQIYGLITQSFPEQQWNSRLESDGQSVALTVLPDRVVLRHRESVHKEVEALLRDSGIAMPAGAATGGLGEVGGGGGGRGGGFFSRPQQ